MDWLCPPRLDSPSVFASLLDGDKGGHFRIAPYEADAFGSWVLDQVTERAGTGSGPLKIMSRINLDY